MPWINRSTYNKLIEKVIDLEFRIATKASSTSLTKLDSNIYKRIAKLEKYLGIEYVYPDTLYPNIYVKKQKKRHGEIQ